MAEARRVRVANGNASFGKHHSTLTKQAQRQGRQLRSARVAVYGGQEDMRLYRLDTYNERQRKATPCKYSNKVGRKVQPVCTEMRARKG